MDATGVEAGAPAAGARMVFAVMSAVAPAAVVDQLAQALAPHTVLVHHDFAQQAQFSLAASNACFVPEPRRTGWGVWGFTEGIFHTLRHALAAHDFDYLQLLSPSCLPIKPMAQLQAHVQGGHDAHFECVDLLADRDALMSVGWRAFAPQDTQRHRVLRRLSRVYFGDHWARREQAGIWLRSARPMNPAAWVALAATRAASWAPLGRHPFDASLRPYYGSVWFGASRPVVQRLLEGFDRDGIGAYFSRLRLPEEFLVPTLLMQASQRPGTLNHHIQCFDEAHPGELAESHVPMLAASGAYFARKFPQEAQAPVRLRVLQELCGPADAAAVGAAPGCGGAQAAAGVQRPRLLAEVPANPRPVPSAEASSATPLVTVRAAARRAGGAG